MGLSPLVHRLSEIHLYKAIWYPSVVLCSILILARVLRNLGFLGFVSYVLPLDFTRYLY